MKVFLFDLIYYNAFVLLIEKKQKYWNYFELVLRSRGKHIQTKINGMLSSNMLCVCVVRVCVSL